MTQALTLAPENARVWDAKGVVLYQLDQPEAALAAYDEALHLDPSRRETQQNRRYALARLLLPNGHGSLPTHQHSRRWMTREVWLFELRRLARLRRWPMQRPR